ncbi:MAG: hypothetical protein KDE56_06870 [Anaerolineales bacterium]|nr:hypothetical protein [Anaerolineales bacterium]
MSEIISIHVGKCGNRLGHEFWAMLAAEHGIGSVNSTESQVENRGIFFSSAEDGLATVPRAVFVDFKPETKPAATAFAFRSENFIFAENSVAQNYAKGYYTEGPELIDKILKAISNEVGRCSNLQGFIMTHSLGGGVGSGLGSLIIAKLRETYPDKTITTFSVLPSVPHQTTVLEPYNAVLAIEQLSKHADLVFFLDNDKLYEIYFREFGKSNPTYQDLNHLLLHVISNVTAPLRFHREDQIMPSEQRIQEAERQFDLDLISFDEFQKAYEIVHVRSAPLTLHDMVKKLVSVSSEANSSGESLLHFLVTTLYPIISRDNKPSGYYSGNSDSSLGQRQLILSAVDVRETITMANIAIMRGPQAMYNKDYLPNTIQSSWPSGDKNSEIISIEIPAKGITLGATLIANSTVIASPLERIASNFDGMFRSKAFVQHYTGEGMEVAEMAQARSKLDVLITAYRKMEEAFRETEPEYYDGEDYEEG